MMLLSYHNITKSYGDLNVLKNVNMDIHSKERIGLVGNNGAGKTTLTNIIFGCIEKDSGTIKLNQTGLKIGYLLQSGAYRINMLKESEVSEDFLETTSRLGLKKVYGWDNERFTGLSGGERTKLALAELWAEHTDMLILDEPTNHMDFQGIEWLVSELNNFQGTVLIISHDRYFLDRTVNHIVEIEDGCAFDYPGNYSFYRDEKKRIYESRLHQYLIEKQYKETIENQIDNLKNWSHKAHNQARETAIKNGVKFGGKEFYRGKAKKMDKQIKSRVNRLQKLIEEGTKKPKEEQKISFEFNNTKKLGRNILEANDIYKSYKDKVLFKNSSFYIKRGDRIGIIGPNGCGKTTLIRVILGEESLDNGRLWVSPSMKAAYLNQNIDDLNCDSSALEILDALEGERRTKAQNLLSNMGFTEAMMKKAVSFLSLGERRRVKLANLILNENNCLILDEPTNHLDLHSREELEDALCNYEGTILLVSHDRYMLEKICNRLLVFDGCSIKSHEFGFKEYQDMISQTSKTTKDNTKSSAEEKMLIENRIAYIIGEISRLTPNDPEYASLDKEFNYLMNQKKNYK